MRSDLPPAPDRCATCALSIFPFNERNCSEVVCLHSSAPSKIPISYCQNEVERRGCRRKAYCSCKLFVDKGPKSNGHGRMGIDRVTVLWRPVGQS